LFQRIPDYWSLQLRELTGIPSPNAWAKLLSQVSDATLTDLRQSALELHQSVSEVPDEVGDWISLAHAIEAEQRRREIERQYSAGR
jgi:hypothetical protein